MKGGGNANTCKGNRPSEEQPLWDVLCGLWGEFKQISRSTSFSPPFHTGAEGPHSGPHACAITACLQPPPCGFIYFQSEMESYAVQALGAGIADMLPTPFPQYKGSDPGSCAQQANTLHTELHSQPNFLILSEYLIQQHKMGAWRYY